MDAKEIEAIENYLGDPDVKQTILNTAEKDTIDRDNAVLFVKDLDAACLEIARQDAIGNSKIREALMQAVVDKYVLDFESGMTLVQALRTNAMLTQQAMQIALSASINKAAQRKASGE